MLGLGLGSGFVRPLKGPIAVLLGHGGSLRKVVSAFLFGPDFDGLGSMVRLRRLEDASAAIAATALKKSAQWESASFASA